MRTFRQPLQNIRKKPPKKTSIGRRNVGTSTMNKHKRRIRGKSKYRGQG